MLSNVSRRWPRPIGPEVLTELTVKSHHAYKLLLRYFLINEINLGAAYGEGFRK